MCMAVNRFKGSFRTGGHLVTNQRHDDTVLIASTESESKQLVRWSHSTEPGMGLKINVKKTEVMTVAITSY